MAAAKICSVAGCGNKVIARGWCRAHYQRWARYGDPTDGRALDGAAQSFVTNVAVPYAQNDCLIWPFGLCKGRGYMKVGGVTQVAHRVVCEAVYGAPPHPEMDSAHSCGNKVCVNPKHLRWATRLENEADKLVHGTRARGERHGNSKLSTEAVQAILRMKGTAPSTKVGPMFDLHPATVRQIWRGDRWAHIQTGGP